MPDYLNDPVAFDALETRIEQAIRDDEAVHQKYHEEWNEVDDRLNTDYIPTGFSQTFSLNLATINDPKLAKEKRVNIKEFVQVNRTRPNHESVLGDFIVTRRRLSIQGRNPTDRNRAKVYKSYVEFIEDQEMLPENIYFPAMDNAWSKGLHWIKLDYNARANKFRGKFEISDVNCRDVLVDARSRGHFFRTSKRFTHRMQFTLADAKRVFRKYPLFNPNQLGNDNYYDVPYRRTESAAYDLCTIYEHQFCEDIVHYYQITQGEGGLEDAREVNEEEFYVLRDNPETAQTVFEGDEERVYYITLWNPSTGLFHVQRNPLNMFTIVPLANIFSDSRTYPLGDVVIFKNLQDLLDVLVTVFLENAKRNNIPIGKVDMKVYAQYQSAIDNALRHGGAAPGVEQIFYPQAINSALVNLIPWVIGWIQDTAAKHGASMGEIPSRQIAKETIQTLIAKDRQSHGRKDMMIKWTLTQIARGLVKMVALYKNEADFIQLRDTRPGSPTHIPVNQIWTEDDYVANLAMVFKIPTPQNAQEEEAFNNAIAEARQRFETENDVKPTEIPGYSVDGTDFTQDQIDSMIQKAGLSDEEFIQKYQPIPMQIQAYQVNMLDPNDADLDVVYEIDNDYQSDPEFRANRALLLNQRGAMARLDMLKEMNVPNAEELIQNANDENEAIAIAKVIGANPQLKELMMQAIQAVGSNGKAAVPAR